MVTVVTILNDTGLFFFAYVLVLSVVRFVENIDSKRLLNYLNHYECIY